MSCDSFYRSLGSLRAAVSYLQEALLEERRKLEAAMQKEMKGKAPAGDPSAGPAASSAAAAVGSSSGEAAAEEGTADDGQPDALDAFMSDVQHQIEEDKVGFAA